jgi:hypothetical protein
LAKVTIHNPINGKKYVYNSKNRTDYEIKDIEYKPIEYDEDLIPNNLPQNNLTSNKKAQPTGPSDVDINIPLAKTTNPHAYALIFGNEDYSSFQTG